MIQTGIAIDLGTSGFRVQALDLDSGAIIASAISTCHPLPGSNVIDHIHFTLEAGLETANSFVIQALNRLLEGLNIDLSRVVRTAVCGNPIQLSLFISQDIEDLAYAGSKKLESLGKSGVVRDACIIKAGIIKELILPEDSEIIIPPCVHMEVGADALAMIIKTGILERNETAIVTDFGTNAEMALFHNGVIYTGSTAAGPAIEGRHISCGTLAVPGAVSDIEPEGGRFRLTVLDERLLPEKGDLISLPEGETAEKCGSTPVTGITGTGVIALISEALENKLISIPQINSTDGLLKLTENVSFNRNDLMEAGKATGAIRTGHLTLCANAGISPDDIQTACLSGAAGTYLDVRKAQTLGLVPPLVKTVIQAGNTSLAMARDLVLQPEKTDEMSRLAEKLRDTYCMFSSSKIFNRVYLLEFSYWTEGMPLNLYRSFLKKYGLPDFNPGVSSPEIIRTVENQLGETGSTPVAVVDISCREELTPTGCTGCKACEIKCPQKAIHVGENQPPVVSVDLSACNGVSCKNCERVCPEKCFSLNGYFQKFAGQTACL
ncbi:MAG: methylamine methyltransferase corrinoid protein reductive activase [Firmicutes bacterium]|nr:methylamine methyltransferase corrinoid protein reductive activase [Bacillota bacterium]